ncbi:MAG: endonuclease MutS2 [Lachnospiraceae bacterium]|uniref:endonuclease MutS2 n=1 Tax=Agathobacter sp. TaxID=2021311 RepID=UPI002A5E3F15|nr:endonuclease MutS2 [Lachnospiraceae bacterium]MDD7667386.1 endonuclease MutS2 [Lachnospiraceae bacterium]MDY2619785.1 endonuclease MutS2 [Agathobacter sp.]
MNQKVYHTLEYYKILDMLAGYASCEETRKRALALTPITDAAEIEHLQQTTSDALSRLYKGSGISFAGIHNVNASLKRLDIGGSLNTTELLHICSLLEVAKRAKAYDRSDRADDKTDSLSPLFSQIEPLSPLLEEIKRCVIGEDEIADDASPALFKIRKSIRGMNDRIHAQLTNLMNNTTTRNYLQDAVITMRDGRYCLPVKAEAKTSVPGMVHDQSSSGSTLFIEPMAVVNLNNELRELFLKEQDEINVILADLSNRVAENANGIRQDYSVLAELDFIFAKAQLAKSYNGVAPIFNEEGRIHIRKGRHPLLDTKKVVPIDVRLGEDFRQLIVTGPNTGGKTVSLKTVGLLTLMGQSGLHIPAADRSELAIFHEIFADIGDEQSIEQSLSTFSSHMTNIVKILDQADDRSLCLFDELCAGTDPTEGAALAISILHKLHQYGATTMATTHYSELKVYALSTPGVENACCEFNVETLSPTYRLLIGIPGKSNAFAISSKLGLAANIIDDAKSRLSDKDVDFEDMLANLEASRITIEKEQLEIKKYKAEVENLKKKLTDKNEKLDARRDEILRKANEEAVQILKEAKDLADETIRNFNKYGQGQAPMSKMEKERSKVRDKMNKSEKNLSMKKKEMINHKVPKKLRIGDSVKVLSMNLKGTVHTLPNAKGDLYVQMGILRSLVNINDLVLIDDESTSPIAKKYGGGSSSGKIKMSKSASVSTEINLIGMTVDEAIAHLDKYLDDAYIAHLPSVRIVHGKGTGALRSAVHAHLKRQKYVKSFRLGEAGEGDAGVTIAEFE